MASILLLGDITGMECVAVRLMTRALEARGHEVCALPTALISNTFSRGCVQTLDTTAYLLSTLTAWEGMGVRFAYAGLGYVTGMPQARALAQVADRLREQGAYVLLDPILGDDGRPYRSITREQAEGMRLLADHADLLTPNLTEARLLTQSGASPRELAALLSQGRRSVLIKSCPGESETQGAVIGLDAPGHREIDVRFERVAGRHYGTGDLFGALLLHALSCGRTLEDAAREASRAVGESLTAN